MTDFTLSFPNAYGPINASALFRCAPEDFQVVENLGFTPTGEGEHVFLHVVKCGENTAWIAEQIAKLAKIKVSDVSYSGRKDRHAITRQWFSVYLPLKRGATEPDWLGLDSPTTKVLEVARHNKKLRRGEHQSNSFVITLKDVCVSDTAELDNKIFRVFSEGVPNFYGEQRFGNQGNNLVEADLWLKGERAIRDRQKQGLILSASRSYLFNLVLAARVANGTWNTVVEGEPLTMPSSPLWGRGRNAAKEPLLELETSALSEYAVWLDALEHKGLMQERRNNVLMAENGRSRWVDEKTLELSFDLAGGEFATSLLKELFELKNEQSQSISMSQPAD